MNSTGFKAHEGVDMARQGCFLSDTEIRKIVALLASTDMTMCEIATRMGLARSTIAAVNRRFQVRDYAGLRNRWTCNTEKAS